MSSPDGPASPGAAAAGPTSHPGIAGIPPPDAAYSSSSFAGVRGLEDCREVLAWIDAFVPTRVELFPVLKPFLPEYAPAPGSIDNFIKPPRPDGRDDDLGMKRVDEPSAVQSDPTVLDLQLRALSKKSGLEPVSVRALDHAARNPKEITKWIASIAELHRSSPPPSVNYSRPMPEIDALMQEWPPAFEELLRQVPLPTADMDMPVATYARVVCALLDIPVHPAVVAGGGRGAGGGAAAGGGGAGTPGPLIQALHVLVTLYSAFRANPHFAHRQI